MCVCVEGSKRVWEMGALFSGGEFREGDVGRPLSIFYSSKGEKHVL